MRITEKCGEQDERGVKLQNKGRHPATVEEKDESLPTHQSRRQCLKKGEEISKHKPRSDCRL